MNYKDNNKVTVVGLLSENNVEKKEKDGRNYLAGNFKIQVTPENIVQVNVFSYEMTKAGGENPAYKAIYNLSQKGVSLAACGGDESKATKVRFTNGRLEENLYVSRFNGNIVSTFRISASFFTMSGITEDNKANFQASIYIDRIREEADASGDITGRLIIDGMIQQYNRYDKISFIAESEQAIGYIRSNWKEGDTVSISGKIVNKTVTTVVSNENDTAFGEPEEESRTYSRTELIITSGGEPKEDEFAYDSAEMKEGIAVRQRRMDEMLERSKVGAARVDDSDF